MLQCKHTFCYSCLTNIGMGREERRRWEEGKEEEGEEEKEEGAAERGSRGEVERSI